jgi:hypothetical protein
LRRSADWAALLTAFRPTPSFDPDYDRRIDYYTLWIIRTHRNDRITYCTLNTYSVFLLIPSIVRFAWVAVAVAVVALATPAFAADGIEEVLRETHWGESSDELFHQFGTHAIRLPRALDFGDSYADVVLRGKTLGAVPMVVFFQMDKVTHGLKRIQLERPRHGVNPPAFRAIAAALHAEYGKPDQTCIIPVLPGAGYQAAAEERWVHDGTAISAIFRDTTLQAFEGCLFGPATGWCGLQGQLLVRIGPPDGGADPCSLARHHGRPVAAAPWGTSRTESSNPPSSIGESAANLTSCGLYDAAF